MTPFGAPPATPALARALVVFAALLPLGEGACAAGGGIVAFFAARAWWGAGQGFGPRRAIGVPWAARWALSAQAGGAAVATSAALASPWGLRASALGALGPQLACALVWWAGSVAGPRVLRRACAAFVGAACLAAAYGALCAARNAAPGEAWVRLDAVVGAQGLVPGSARRVAAGFYFHRLKMAHLLVVALAPPVATLVGARAPWRRQLAACCAAGVLGLALLATYARGAVLACALATAACLVLGRAPLRAWLRLTAVGAAVGLALWTWAPATLARAGSAHDPAAAAVRAVIWSQAVAIVHDAPFGVGLGNYRRVVGAYYDAAAPLTDSPRTAPHARLLHALAEGGVAGLACELAFWGTTFAAALAAARGGGRHTRQAGRAGLFAVVGLCGVGLTHDVFYHQAVAWVGYAAVGLLLASVAPLVHEAGPKPPPAPAAALGGRGRGNLEDAR